ncbi:phospholipase B1, membrane-associated-like [Ptychodera flava]|uniref:phospholipase B1, membrane-associated-like n=1 Tax=Ptychodera flava TaxID=63121 RepID=UPI00396AAF04
MCHRHQNDYFKQKKIHDWLSCGSITQFKLTGVQWCYEFAKMVKPAFLVCICILFVEVGVAEEFDNWREYVELIESLNEDDFKEKEMKSPYNIPPEFPCAIESPANRPKMDVHHLHPADIKVIAAMGDSLTAGNGAKANNPLQCLIEYRGVVYSVGGDDYENYSQEEGKVITLATMLKQYQEGISGYSIGTGDVDSEGANLNVGVAGARSEHMETHANWLIERLQEHETDYENDWKMVTLFIGGNDLCAWCRDKDKYKPETYIDNIRKALDVLHDELPKTFVNLISVIQVIEINKMDDLLCNIIHQVVCPCAKLSGNNTDEVSELVDVMREYQRLTRELVDSGRYDTRDDFTVVVQPFLEHTGMPWNEEIGGWDDSMMAPDCFHFSELGHQLSAAALWNNLFEAVGNKTTDFDYSNLYFTCPGPSDFFRTRLNNGTEARNPTTMPVPVAPMTTRHREGVSKASLPMATIYAFVLVLGMLPTVIHL